MNTSGKVRVIWMSRHPMSEDQRIDLEKFVSHYAYFEYEQVNVTFPAQSTEAVELIQAMAERRSPDKEGEVLIAGVFPAHIAGAIARNHESNGVVYPVLVPVSVPAPAVEGETRGGGFIHSHWEGL